MEMTKVPNHCACGGEGGGGLAFVCNKYIHYDYALTLMALVQCLL